MDQALWTAALVAYVRCFTSGKRARLDANIFDGKPEQVLRAHRYFENVRNKYVAHSVNPFEEYATGARVTNLEGEEPQVESILYTVNRLTGLGPEDVHNLGELARYAQWHVGERMTAVDRRLLSRVNALSPEQLRNLPRYKIDIEHGWDTAGRPRR